MRAGSGPLPRRLHERPVVELARALLGVLLGAAGGAGGARRA